MTPLWHDGPLEALHWDGASPVVWRVAGDKATRRRHARALIAGLSGEREDAVAFDRSHRGAPVVAAPSGWHIGLSSRGDHGLIGVARRPIAVDRELIDDDPPLWDMLTDAEACALNALDADVRPRAWLRRWTIKEAHAKLIGEPRRIAPEAIETRVIDAVYATASFEGVSHCWTRHDGAAIETVAMWAEAV